MNKNLATKHVVVSKRVRVRPNQGCSRERAGRSQPGINFKKPRSGKRGEPLTPFFLCDYVSSRMRKLIY
jgi:hypothetical protein